jgi:hypothetical protein
VGAQPHDLEHFTFPAMDDRYRHSFFGLLWFRTIPDDPLPFKGGKILFSDGVKSIKI